MMVRPIAVWMLAAACGSFAPASAAPEPAAESAGSAAWQRPPQTIADILTAPRLPRGPASVSPDGRLIVLPELPSLIPLATLAEPVDKLAGLEVLPAWHCTRGQLKSAWSGFSIAPIAGGAAVRAQLPAGARLGAPLWSPDGRRLACAVYAAGGAELWVVTAGTGAARRVEGVRLNTVLDPEIAWTNDGTALFVPAVVARGPAAAAPRVPPGPETRQAAGRPAPQRTARDVLRTSADAARFTATTTVWLTRVPAGAGRPVRLGRADMIADWSVSPDERHLMVETLTGTPFGFPCELFPRTVTIVDAAGGLVAVVGRAPLDERSAISSVAPLGPRGATWSPDGQSLWWFDWRDTPGADPAAAIRDTTRPQPGTDRLMRLDQPFTGAPREVATSEFQFAAMLWSGDGRRLLLFDGYAPRRHERRWWIDPAAPEARHVLVLRSSEGVYDAPGVPLAHMVHHQRVLWTTAGGDSLWLAGEGFRADGQRPFLDRVALASGGVTRVWECAADVLELPQALLDPGGRRFVTSRQSHSDPPNWWLRAADRAAPAPLSRYTDPAPALSAAKRLRFTFVRPDSVRLNAEAVLPADWTPGTRLPTIFWVYPNDYRSAAAAQQNRRAPNRFPSQSPLNPEVLVTQGYAVVYPDIAVVGTNDRYVEEIRASARAAIEECVRQGFCDAARVGVGGHSYGAFSTANLLAHTELFRAGTASDGAYNRTLTPFTFQAEERNLWEARDTYLAMSPFLYANDIRSPLLLLHNLDDTNVGTNPIQSERMFEALNGLGRTSALVEYPYEDHAPVARETVLDYWARVLGWFDRWVKNAGPEARATP
jgi:dipeptidyl aminopeptidase/acylaminoacyl peptidase